MLQELKAQGIDWPGITTDVDQLISSCEECLTFNPGPLIQRKIEQSFTASTPFELIAMDTAQPDHPSGGFKYVLVVVDVLTRFVQLRALRNKSAESIGMALADIFGSFGFPASIAHDNGREFLNHVVDSLVSAIPIDQRLSSEYHPQGNGLAESFVKTTKRLLRKMCSKSHKWHVSLPFIQLAINGKQRPDVPYTPFQAMFGRNLPPLRDYHNSSLPIIDPDNIGRYIARMADCIFPLLANKRKLIADRAKTLGPSPSNQVILLW